MRFHQSWYRHHVLGLPAGASKRAKRYGNYLSAADGAAGFNFLSDDIFEVALEREKRNHGAVNADRLLRNLLSSQPMCFNLFAMLSLDRDLASRLMSELPKFAGARVISVDFEYAPDKATHLNDGTAFDAVIIYERMGKRRFIGIETKLTEPFSHQSYPFAQRYAQWVTRGAYWWRPHSEAHFPLNAFNQLWRNHLLVYAMLNQARPAFDEGFLAVVHHHMDDDCISAFNAYGAHLLPSGTATLFRLTLKDVLEIWHPLLNTRAQREWFASFRLRYLDLDASEPAWREHAHISNLVSSTTAKL